jgi:cyclopropane-fatty-acyl-phospholipid synthase
MCKGDAPVLSSNDAPRRVAIVGGGVTGLSAAWHLMENTPDNIQVLLFEAQDRLGGHAYTIPVQNAHGKGTTTDVDIGFMVFNESNYPNMIRWFEKLGVPNESTDMSLSVSLDNGETIEWNSDGLNGLLARRSQAVDPQFYTMIRDMVRFNKEAAQLLLLPEDDPRKAITTGQYLRTHGYSQAFGMYYLLPMMAALWSASMEDVLAFPAVQLISFLCNHKMLQLFDRPQVRIQMFVLSCPLVLHWPLTECTFHLGNVPSVEDCCWSIQDIYPQSASDPGKECANLDSDSIHDQKHWQWRCSSV